MTLAYPTWGEAPGHCLQTPPPHPVAQLESALQCLLNICLHTDHLCWRASHSPVLVWRSKDLKETKRFVHLTWVTWGYLTVVLYATEVTPVGFPHRGTVTTSAITTLTVSSALLALQMSSFQGRTPDFPTTGWTSWMPAIPTVAWRPVTRPWLRSGMWVTPLWTVMDGPYTHPGHPLLQLQVRLTPLRQMLLMRCSVRCQTGLEQEPELDPSPRSVPKRWPGHHHRTYPPSGAVDTLERPPLPSPFPPHLGLLLSPTQYSHSRVKIQHHHLILSLEAASGIRLVHHLHGPLPQNEKAPTAPVSFSTVQRLADFTYSTCLILLSVSFFFGKAIKRWTPGL